MEISLIMTESPEFANERCYFFRGKEVKGILPAEAAILGPGINSLDKGEPYLILPVSLTERTR